MIRNAFRATLPCTAGFADRAAARSWPPQCRCRQSAVLLLRPIACGLLRQPCPSIPDRAPLRRLAIG